MNNTTMTPEEINYRERSKVLWEAAEGEPDPELSRALYYQCALVTMRALWYDLRRKQEHRKAMGLSLTAP